MARLIVASIVAVTCRAEPQLKDFGQVCRAADKSDGGCMVDGTGCDGVPVEFAYFGMNVSKWDDSAKKNTPIGKMSSYAITGSMDTWQMYLHGPLLRPTERATPESIPPLYTHATWNNKIYRFDGFSEPVAGKSLMARQKMVGWANAPSTSWPIVDSKTSKLNGLMVAEGQPFFLSNFAGKGGGSKMEIGTGGVSVLHNDANKMCDKIFPKNTMSEIMGDVVNTVDCHKTLGVCFFTVWKFYDDASKMMQPIINKLAPDCLHYCIAEDLDTDPRCTKIDVVVDENGEKICHKDGVGAVHGMTIGNDSPDNATHFDIFLVFTGGLHFDKGESSMKKVKVQVSKSDGGDNRDLQVLKSIPYAQQLFVDLPPAGLDVGGDHAWVDDTRKLIWVSTFRTGGAGVHMLDYETGALMYSVTGLDHYLPGQYLYSAGIHGTGTVGKKGSYIAVATSACYNIAACAPIPWASPIPEKMWAKGVQFIIDIGNFKVPMRVEFV